MDRFEALFVDGEEVSEDNYDLTDGSTVITFHADYLDTLSIGTHEVVVAYDNDVEIRTTFEIVKESSSGDRENDNEQNGKSAKGLTAPNTGGNETEKSFGNFVSILPLAMIGGVIVLLYVKRMRKSHRKFD